MVDLGPLPYTILPQWHSKPRKLRVVCVGAGASGLLAIYKIKSESDKYEMTIYDKNPEVGGTWHENRYPGCACDVPAHIYTYSFEPKADWSSFYAGSAEIKQYFKDFADKYNLWDNVNLNAKVVRADWSEQTGTYQLEIERNGKIVRDQCDILINGTGNLSRWKWPDVPGLDSFKGSLLHSANWEDNLSLEGKTVAVIGTGSSAIQVVPKIQPIVKELVHFMRSTAWISAPFLEDALKNAGAGQGVPADTSLQQQHQYTEEEKEHFRKHPDEFLRYRRGLEVQFNKMFEMFLRDSDASRIAQDSMQTEMHRRLGPGNEDLKKRLVPSWPPGCRRITPGIGYLEALVKDNVSLVHRGVARVTPEGVIDDDGVEHQVDVIICATGFDVSFKPSFQIIGTDGLSMEQAFDPEPYAYLGMTVPRFPNYFSINSVRGSWAVGTALNSIEACLNYIVACANRMQHEGIRALEVKMEPLVSLYAHIDEWHKRSVWGADCKSWYKNNIPNGRLWIWGGSALHYIKTIEYVRWEHYDFRYQHSNPWAFLGDGQVKAEITKDEKGLAPYIRSRDEPWHIE